MTKPNMAKAISITLFISIQINKLFNTHLCWLIAENNVNKQPCCKKTQLSDNVLVMFSPRTLQKDMLLHLMNHL